MFERKIKMRSFINVCFARLRFLSVFILFTLPFLLLPASASAGERNYHLVSTDARVLEWNAVFENAFHKLENELNILSDEFARKLTPVVQVLFDYSHMDWIVYFRTEELAFRPTNVWLKENPLSQKYENLYQQNMLFALNFRMKQIKRFRDKTDFTHRYSEALKTSLLVEIKEAQYRVNVWTEERLRPRLYRAEKAWDTYREGVLKFAKDFGWDQTQIMEFDIELLEYRYALLQRQREALFRLKFESEDY